MTQWRAAFCQSALRHFAEHATPAPYINSARRVPCLARRETTADTRVNKDNLVAQYKHTWPLGHLYWLARSAATSRDTQPSYSKATANSMHTHNSSNTSYICLTIIGTSRKHFAYPVMINKDCEFVTSTSMRPPIAHCIIHHITFHSLPSSIRLYRQGSRTNPRTINTLNRNPHPRNNQENPTTRCFRGFCSGGLLSGGVDQRR